MHAIALILAHLLTMYLISKYGIALLIGRLISRYKAGHTDWRIKMYASFLFLNGLELLWFIIIFIGSGWSEQMLGLRLPANVPLAMVFVAIISLLISIVVKLTGLLMRDPDVKKLAKHHFKYDSPIPFTPKEQLLFILAMILVGITEELLFRGFLPLYLSTIFPKTPFFVAILLSACIFGLAHLPRGKWNALFAGVSGFIGSLCYALMGSLFPLILVHALCNIRNLMLVKDRTKVSIGTTE